MKSLHRPAVSAALTALSLIIAQAPGTAAPVKSAKKPAKPAAKITKPAKPAPKPAAKPAAPLGAISAEAIPDNMKPYTEEIPGTTVKFDMVPIPGGSIATADGKQVAVKPLWVGKLEVRWEEYDLYYVGKTPAGGQGPADAVSKPSRTYIPPDWGYGHNGFPAISIHPNGAEHYCQWLSLKTGHKYRLPTEAEWEFACRAGGKADSITPASLLEQAWVKENAALKTHPAGKKSANPWGLQDILGNAAEICVTADGKYVVRGGSWRNTAAETTCRTRQPQSAEWQADDPQLPKSKWWLSNGDFVGFRIVRDAE